MTFTVPYEKINKLLTDIKNILMQNVLTPKRLAKITGQLSFMHLAIGPLVRLFTRNMYHEIESRTSWYEPKIISKQTKDELEFWLNSINIYNGYTFKPRALTTYLVFTDASDDGYGGFILKRLNREVCSAKFKDCEKQTSSTHGELLAVKYVLDSFGGMLRNQSVQVNIDNSSACRILSVGSAKPYLQNIAIDVFSFCSKFNIKLIPQWIPREQIELADYCSRIKDTDNWSIDNDSFRLINNLYGPFTVDRFANNLNRKLKCFNSKYHCPGTSHVNAFTDDWSNDLNWLCPPISSIGSVIRHLKLCKAKGTLLVPVWPSSYFWPLIFPNGKQMADFKKGFIIIELFYYSEAADSVFSGYTKFKTIILNIDCSNN